MADFQICISVPLIFNELYHQYPTNHVLIFAVRNSIVTTAAFQSHPVGRNFETFYRKYPNLVCTKKIIIFNGAHHNYD